MGVMPSLFLATAFGYAVQRGNLCMVSGLAMVIERRSPRQIIPLFRSSLWAAAMTWGLWWAGTGRSHMQIYNPGAHTVVGGLLFGIGAAINSGCIFGTLTRLGAGDLSFAVTCAGIAAGAVLQEHRAGLINPAPMGANGPAVPVAIVPLLTLLLLVIAGVDIFRPGRAKGSFWSGERIAIVVGLTGGSLFAARGDWPWTLHRGRLPGAGGPLDRWEPGVALLFLALLGGAMLSALHEGKLRFRASWCQLHRRLLGGVLMGLGAAVTPGGNGTIILHAIPDLSPHAPVAYGALLLGCAAMLATFGQLRKAAHLRVRRHHDAPTTG
jgi:uncharacterized protein